MLAHAKGLLELSYLITDTSQLAHSKSAFHLTKNSSLNFRNFRMLNGTVFSTRSDRSRSIPGWAHFSTRITRENAEDDEVAVLGAVSCFMWRSLKRIQNSTLPRYLWEKWESMQAGRTEPQEIRNDQSTIFQEIRSQEQVRSVADHFASSEVSTRKTRRHPVAFHD